jgi:hypothetical protein
MSTSTGRPIHSTARSRGPRTNSGPKNRHVKTGGHGAPRKNDGPACHSKRSRNDIPRRGFKRG